VPNKPARTSSSVNEVIAFCCRPPSGRGNRHNDHRKEARQKATISFFKFETNEEARAAEDCGSMIAEIRVFNNLRKSVKNSATFHCEIPWRFFWR
jgi:hypothetical protein